MTLARHFPILSTLFVANGVALGFLLVTEPAGARGNGDFCLENQVKGCACLSGAPFNPDGCHESFAEQFDCRDAEGCEA